MLLGNVAHNSGIDIHPDSMAAPAIALACLYCQSVNVYDWADTCSSSPGHGRKRCTHLLLKGTQHLMDLRGEDQLEGWTPVAEGRERTHTEGWTPVA